MKFLCPSCKAKYQIADDKVAGRSVRMKCRKCGHLISIAKTVTEGSVSKRMEGLSSKPPPASSRDAAVPPPRVQRPAPPPRPSRGGIGPAATPSPQAAPVRGGLPPRRTAQSSQALGIGESTADPVNKGATNGSNGKGLPAYGALDDDEHTVVAPSGGLASAFSHAVTGPESAPLSSLSTPADEWYVGINGVPVGPIRLSELRSKASTGTITLDSLVWRDGFEEWMALRTFPELVAIVEEGFSSARASLSPLSPQWSPTPGPVAPPPTAQPEVYDPFRRPGANPNSTSSADALFPAGAADVGFGTPPPASTGPGVVTGKPEIEIDESVIPKRRTGTPLVAWIAVAVALIFGLGIGFVVFDRGPGETVVKYVEVPSTAGGAPGPGTETTEAPTNETVETADAGGAKTVKQGGAVAKAGGATPTETAKEPAGKPLTGLAGLQGLQGGGPTSGPGSTSPAAKTSDGLDSTQVQQTVGRYTPSVRRGCWQPALDARLKDAPSSARVSVTIKVAPGGNVTSASTSGDPKGYPGLASCIGSRVRAWQFPATGGPTTVNVPFVFAAQ